jgi:hypothetical protein
MLLTQPFLGYLKVLLYHLCSSSLVGIGVKICFSLSKSISPELKLAVDCAHNCLLFGSQGWIMHMIKCHIDQKVQFCQLIFQGLCT